MTQHILQEDTQSDIQTMRRLGIVIGGFVVATIIMATAIGIVLG